MQGYLCYILQEVQHMPKRKGSQQSETVSEEWVAMHGKKFRLQNIRPVLPLC